MLHQTRSDTESCYVIKLNASQYEKKKYVQALDHTWNVERAQTHQQTVKSYNSLFNFTSAGVRNGTRAKVFHLLDTISHFLSHSPSTLHSFHFSIGLFLLQYKPPLSGASSPPPAPSAPSMNSANLTSWGSMRLVSLCHSQPIKDSWKTNSSKD